MTWTREAYTADGDSLFLSEWVAGGQSPYFLPISTACNSRCLFCTKNYNPFSGHPGLFRDLSDIEYQLSLMPEHSRPINLTSVLPGRLAEGEALLHPRIFDILALVRRRYPTNQLRVYTNGIILGENGFLSSLSRYRPMSICLSIHSTRPELWARIFQRSQADAHRTLAAIQELLGWHFTLEAAVVPLPRLCGWDDVRETMRFLDSSGARRIYCHFPGYTDLTPAHIVRDIACDLDDFTAFAREMRAALSSRIIPMPDMDAPVQLPLARIVAQTLRGNAQTLGGPYRSVVWLVSRAAHARLQSLLATRGPFPNIHVLHPVANRTFGGNVIVGGLLTVSDFVAAGAAAMEAHPQAELLLVPTVAFDSFQRDLLGESAHAIAERLQRPVWLVDPGTGEVRRHLLARPVYRAADCAHAQIEQAVSRLSAEDKDGDQRDPVAVFPVESPHGALSAEALSVLLADWRSPRAGSLLSRHISMMKDDRALCVEQWKTAGDDAAVRNRWLQLEKHGGRWLLRWIHEGEAAW